MSGRLPFYPQCCWTCEGSGIRPSMLYLIPFWPVMTCKRCEGTGIHGVTHNEAQTVYLAAAIVVRMSHDELLRFIPSLRTEEASGLKQAIQDLKDTMSK